jgi:IclR family acetate operon transcriptional repressor
MGMGEGDHSRVMARPLAKTGADTEARRPSTSDRPAGPRPGSMLQSLQRGTAVLDAIASSPERLSAKDLAGRVDLDRTVVHRVLRTLEFEQFVDEVGGRYGLGPRALLLGNSYLRHNPLRQASLPYQVDLLYRGFPDHPWALSVVIPVGAEMTQVTQIWSPTAPLDSLFGVPDRLAIDQTAAGRCILAALPPAEVVALIGTEAAEQLAPRFEEIRAAGYVDFVAPDERGNAPAGLSALSALIRNPSGRPIAGLTLSGTALEEHLDRDSAVAERLRRTAHQIGRLVW